MVDPLYRALVLAALTLAGCEGGLAPDAGSPQSDASEGSDIPADDTGGEEDVSGEEDAPCPADAERQTPPCYFIL